MTELKGVKKCKKLFSVLLAVLVLLQIGPLWSIFALKADATAQDDYTPTTRPATTFPATVNEYSYSIYNNYAVLTSYNESESIVYVPSSVDGYTVKAIGERCFRYKENITKIVLPETVETIENTAFYGCESLSTIEIKGNLKNLGSMAFAGCTSLSSIQIDGTNSNYIVIDGVLFDKNQTELIRYPAKKNGTSYSIPRTVVDIAYNAFENNDYLVSVTIPDTIQSIKSDTFNDCDKIASINIPGSVKDIGDNSFCSCDALADLTLNNGLEKIGYSAFSNCNSLKSINVPESVKNIDSAAFSYCTSLVSATIPNTVVDIGWEAFYCCTSLESVNITNIAKNIETVIEGWAFEGCTNLKSISIPVKSIKWSAFEGCKSITNISIPDSVISIEELAFSNCTALAKVTGGNKIEKIGSGVFENTPFYNSKSNWADGALYLGSALIGVDENLSTDYKINENTKAIAIAYVENEPYNSDLASVLADNSSLKSIEMPNTITDITYRAFVNCTSLSEINIPDTVEHIGGAALLNTEIYNNVTNWENGALYIDGCLIKVDKNISGTVTVKDETRIIADEAFLCCKYLASVIISDNILFIGEQTFRECDNLSSIYIPKSISEIRYNAFKDVGLEDVYYAGSENEWNDIDIQGWYNEYCFSHAIIHFDSQISDVLEPKKKEPYIAGFVSEMNLEYKSSIILHSNFENVDSRNITWYVNGAVFAHGDSIILDTLTKDSVVYCEGVDSNGKVYKSDVENIHVRTSFWIRLKAFFKSLFGLLPIIDQK